MVPPHCLQRLHCQLAVGMAKRRKSQVLAWHAHRASDMNTVENNLVPDPHHVAHLHNASKQRMVSTYLNG